MKKLYICCLALLTHSSSPSLADIVPEMYDRRFCLEGLGGEWIPVEGNERGDCDVGERLVINRKDLEPDQWGMRECPKEFAYAPILTDGRRYCVERKKVSKADIDAAREKIWGNMMKSSETKENNVETNNYERKMNEEICRNIPEISRKYFPTCN